MGRQGKPLDKNGIARICDLLDKTDLSAAVIATRAGTSRTTVSNINHKYGIRRYCGNRLSWINKEGRVVSEVYGES